MVQVGTQAAALQLSVPVCPLVVASVAVVPAFSSKCQVAAAPAVIA